MYKKLIVITVFLIITQNIFSQVHLKIYDSENKKGLENVLITGANENSFYGITDSTGICNINTNQLKDTIYISLMGYYHQSLSILNEKTYTIFLKKKNIQIEEVVVKEYSKESIIKNASENYSTQYRNTPYFGKGIYTKTINCNNHYLEYNRGYGFLYSSGYVKYHKFDLDSKFAFVPVNMECSNSYATHDQPIILNPKSAHKGNISFNSFSRELFSFYRAIEAFGPLNPKLIKYYDFKIDTISYDNNQKKYGMYFQSRSKYIPEKLKMACKGRIWINASDFTINKLEIEDINYLYMPFFRKNEIPTPYKAIMSIKWISFNNQLFPENIYLKKYWFDNPCDSLLSFPPSRMRPKKNKLIEYEEFQLTEVDDSKDCKELKFENSHIWRIISILSVNPKIQYDSLSWSKLDFPVQNWESIKLDLSKYETIENQFKKNNNNYYDDWLNFNLINQDKIDIIENIWNQSDTWFNIINKRLKPIKNE